MTEQTADSATAALTGTLPSLVALRAELEDLVSKELLGPAGGPDEEVYPGHVSDRYLVGILSPRRALVRAAQSDALADDGSGGVEDGNADDLALPTDTLAPAALGLTCTVRGDTSSLRVTARWGRYAQAKSETLTTDKGNPRTVWKRSPMSGQPLSVALKEGDIKPVPFDDTLPEVVLQGRVRKLNGDWLVSLFLVNTQPMSARNPKDDELLFQPELQVEALDGAPVFRKRSPRQDGGDVDEQRLLDMLYRRRVEFAVGHGVAVHADVAADNPTHAVRLTTRVMPTYEVPITAPPTAEDIPALADVVLDMKTLAEMPADALITSLRVLPSAYAEWITSNQARCGRGDDGLADFRQPAQQALAACDEARRPDQYRHRPAGGRCERIACVPVRKSSDVATTRSRTGRE